MNRTILIIINLFICAYSYAQPDSILNKNYVHRYEFIESTIQESRKLDSAEINKRFRLLITWAKENKDNALAYHLLFAKTSVTKNIEKDEVFNALDMAIEENHTLTAADGYARLSNLYWRYNKSKGLEFALNSYGLYKNATIREFPPRARFQLDLAMFYYYLGEYTKAKGYLLDLKNADTISLLQILKEKYYKLALVYRENKQLDSAAHCFKEVYLYAKERNIKNIASLSAGNLGSCYSLMKEYDSAIVWFKKELRLKESYKKNFKGGKNELNTYVGIAHVYYKLEKMENAKIHIDSANRIRKNLDTGLVPSLASYYEIYSQIYSKLGVYRKAYLYSDSALHAYGSIYTNKNKKHTYEAEQRIMDSKHNIEILNIQHTRQKGIWIRNFIIVFILLIALIAVLLINRNRQKLVQRRLLLESEKNKAEADLLNFTMALKDKNEQLTALKKDVKKQSNEQDRIHKNQLIIQLQNSTILTDKQWAEFKTKFEQVHHGYIGRIKSKFETITPAEIRYITLVKLGLTNREMANILGVNDSTVRNYKSRLRKKYNLEDKNNFEDLVKKI